MNNSETIKNEKLTIFSQNCEVCEPIPSENPLDSCPEGVKYILDEEDLPGLDEWLLSGDPGHEREYDEDEWF